MNSAGNRQHGPVGILAVAAVGTGMMTVPALAQEYCVGCKGPKALYRCVLERSQPTDIPLKTICTATLARQGRHASCEIRSGTVFDCDAPIRRIDVKTAAEALSKPYDPIEKTPPLAAGTDATAPKPSLPPDQPPAPKHAAGETPPDAPKRPPALSWGGLTEGLTRTTRKTGEAITDGTRKTWNCVASLFKAC
jgi:hypothetical protein